MSPLLQEFVSGKPKPPVRALCVGSREAMACRFEIRVPAGDFQPRSLHLALDEIDRLEAMFTLFRDDSDLQRVNREAGGGWAPVERELYEAISLAVHLWRETGGAFDITASPLWRLWGFSTREGRRPGREEIRSALEKVGSGKIRMDQDRQRIKLPAETEINLGSIGKGFALDKAAVRLAEEGSRAALLHSGWSTILARGSLSSSGWKVGISHPAKPGRTVASCWLQGRALSTSGGLEQSFLQDGIRYSHVIDPRSGLPRTGLWSATAIAATAAEADALATAFAVMDPEEVGDFCQRHPETGALLLESDEEGRLRRTVKFGDSWDGLEVEDE